jgi:hypothetical protein
MTDPEISPGANPELGVVPITEQLNPIFAPTEKQGEVLEQMTLSYVKNNKLPFTTEGVDVGRQIISDAVQKGMELGGLSGIDSAVNIRAVVKDGLAQREKITKESQRICREYRTEVQTAGDRFIGPYAIPSREIVRASQEVNHAVATPVLARSEGLVAKELTRKVLLPQVAHAILGGLSHEQFPDVTLDLFPDVESQAKLLRNAITSMKYRGNPLPQMQIEEVIDFSMQDKTLDPTILAPLVHYIAESSGQDPNEIADYVRDIAFQTDDFIKKAKDVFTAHGIAGNNDTYARDFVYKFFDKRLLLLHPALEEQELVTEYANHSKGAYSMWDEKFSTVIDGYRIPQPDIINRALRLSIAKGRNGTRYKEALGAWKRFERAAGNNEERVKSLERQLHQTESDFAQATPEKMPGSEITVALATNVADAHEYRSVKRKYDEDVRIINRADRLLQGITDLEEEIRRENNGELPPKVVIPGELSLESLHIKRLNKARASVSRSEYQAFDTFSNDFFSADIPRDVKDQQFNFLIMDTATIEEMIVKLDLEKNASLNHEGDIIPSDTTVGDVMRHVNTVVQSLHESYMYLQGQETTDYEQPFTLQERQRYEEYVAIQDILEQKFSRLWSSAEGIPKIFYNYSLSSRISALERIVEARKRLENEERREMVLRTVSAKEFEQNVALAKIQAPTIGDSEEEAADLSGLENAKSVNAIETDLRHFPLPLILEGKDDLIQWATKMIRELPKKPLAYPRRFTLATKEMQQYQRNRQMAALHNLVDLINSPFFPPDELIKGQKTRAIISALNYRYAYLNAKKSLDRDKEKYEEKKGKIDEIAFGNYLRHLGQRKSNFEKEIAEVKARDPNKELIRSLELLNLAVPEESKEGN